MVFSCLSVIVEASSGFTRGSDSFTGTFSLLGIWYGLLEVAGGEVGSAAAFRALASVSRFELLNTTTHHLLPYTVKTLYNDVGRTADRIVIPMVLLYMESRVRLISRKKEADALSRSQTFLPRLTCQAASRFWQDLR